MKSNKGMSLVELIIAIAMLAMVMTAIAGLMSSNTLIFKKQKSDVFVQNMAQETYNRVTDDIMQATDISITGYVNTASETDATAFYFDPTKVGRKQEDGSMSAPVTISKDDADDNFADYQSGEDYTVVYVTEMTIKYSVPLEKAGLPDADKNNPDYYKRDEHDNIVTDINGDPVFNDSLTDTCTATYTFDENVCSLSLSFQKMKNYEITDPKPEDIIFTKCINYVDVGGTSVPGVVAKIDSKHNSIALDMYFAQKSGETAREDGSYPGTGMEYKSKGMINIRNTDVLKDIN